MQDPGDLPARASRPSLLSSGQQAEPDRQRILSALDGTGRPAAAPASAQPARRRPSGLAWGGAVVAAAIVIGGAWFAMSGEDEHAATPVHVAAASAPAASVSPVAAPAASVPPAETAAVLHETSEASAPNPLADLAPTPVPAHGAARGHGDTLTRALETPAIDSPHPHGRKAPAPHKAEPVRVAVAKPAKEKTAKSRRAADQDSDALLLAALMSHMQTPNRKATVAERLQVCKGYNAAGEAQCRARVCAGVAASEPTCKGMSGAVAASPDN